MIDVAVRAEAATSGFRAPQLFIEAESVAAAAAR